MKIIGLTSTGIVLCLLWANFLDWFYDVLGSYEDAFFVYLFAPVWEEMLYRFFPLFIARKLGEEYIFPAVVASSILFGWGHEGGTHEGVLLQGTLGIIFSLAYIRSGYKLYVPILIHMIYNILV